MPFPTNFSCTRCGCEAAAAETTLVQAMGWLVLPFAAAGAEGALACLCAHCRRIESAEERRPAPRRDALTPGAPARAIS